VLRIAEKVLRAVGLLPVRGGSGFGPGDEGGGQVGFRRPWLVVPAEPKVGRAPAGQMFGYGQWDIEVAVQDRQVITVGRGVALQPRPDVPVLGERPTHVERRDQIIVRSAVGGLDPCHRTPGRG
jgi:hypothetical protein